MYQQINCFWPAAQETSLHSKHNEIPGPEPITTAIVFAYLKSVTVSTVKKTPYRVTGNERGTLLPSKSRSTFLDAVIVGQSLRGQENSEKEDEATTLQRILRNPQEQYWQQSRGDYSCFTECSKLLLSQDKRHSIINPLSVLHRESQRQDTRQGQCFRAASTAWSATRFD